MSSLSIFEPMFVLFEYLYNFFAVFGEIASTDFGDIYDSLQVNADKITYIINNPFNDNIFSYTLDFGIIGNGIISVISSLIDLVNVILPNTVVIYDLPLYAVLLVFTIPCIMIFWFVGIVKKFFG